MELWRPSLIYITYRLEQLEQERWRNAHKNVNRHLKENEIFESSSLLME